ncbi:MAG TPA: DUF2235 domain-containing protein [Vicinamibacterales bacterium]|nr:DUF2235 domain-containing protein [Vicinamibacterales bacterium]
MADRFNALYAFDGTWNRKKTAVDEADKNTNVVRFHAAYEETSGAPQFYVSGVGTRFGEIGAFLGGAFGFGELRRIREAHEHLSQRWIEHEGALDIDVIGFSRGAATALDFCHYLQKRGIRDPRTDALVAAAPQIRFLGLWDVVAAFGFANLGNELLNFGHHLSLPTSSVKYCFHAMALDERRLNFLPTRLPGACEVWFRGVHSDVGGGNENRPLNDIGLRWMMCKAIAAGLPISPTAVPTIVTPAGEPHPKYRLPATVRAISAVDRQHYSVAPLKGWTTPPATCPVETSADESIAVPINVAGIEVLPKEVVDRMQSMLEAAEDRAQRLGVSIRGKDDDDVYEWLVTLVEGRVLLVQNAADLERARKAMETLIDTAYGNGARRQYKKLEPVFLNEALFSLPHLFPLTD